MKSAHKSGHMVLSYSYHYANYNNISYEEIEKDLTKTNAAIKTITGTSPTYMRPPYGIVNEKGQRSPKTYWSMYDREKSS